MDPRQLAVYDALYHEIDPEIAAVFKHACDLLNRIDEPGIVYLLGHAGRELSSAVLERIAQDQPAVAEMERPESSDTGEEGPSLRERLASLLGLTLDDQRLDRIFAMLGDDQRDTIARALRLERAHPLVRSWLQVQGSLVASTHYRRGVKPPSPDRAREAFVQLAGLLFNRIGPYFDAQAELDVLLETTTPTADHVARLREALVRPQLRVRFFRALKNPAWLVPLQDGRFFDNPPEWAPTADGGRRLVGWPEGECLIRFAADFPDLVVQTLLRVPAGLINPAVWQVVARGALSLPPAAARRLVPTLVRALRATPVRFFNDIVTDVAASLAKAGDRTTFALTEAVLGLKRLPVDEGPEETKWLRRQSKRLLESMDLYELHEFLGVITPLLASIDPMETWDLLLARLRRARDFLKSAGFDDEDMSHHWCTSLDHAEADDDLRLQLAVAAMRVARDLLAVEPAKVTELLDDLEAGEGPLFTRMRLALLTASGTPVQDEVDRILADPQIAEPPYGAREVAALLRARFETASAAAQAAFLRTLEGGPGDVELRQIAEWRGRDPEDESARREALEDWQRKRLRWFHDRMPRALVPLADRLHLVAERPSLETQNLDELGWHSGGVYSRGDISPRTTDELRAMGDDELLTFLETWSPPAESMHEGPSASGLASALTTLLEEDFDARVPFLAGLAARPTVPPRYAIVAIEALRKRATSGKAAPWPEAVALVAGILDAGERSATTTQRSDWAWARRAAADFLQETATGNTLPAEHLARAFELAEVAVRTSAAWNYERSASAAHFGDIVMEMMNSDSGKTTYAAIALALRAYRVRPTAPSIPDPAQWIRPVLEIVRARDDAGRAGARAQLGAFLPQVMLLDPEWVETHAVDLLGTGMRDPLQNPTWGAYVTMGRPDRESFMRLRDWFGRHATALPAIVAIENAVKKGDRDWLISRRYLEQAAQAYIHGYLTRGEPDRVLELTFESVRAGDRAHLCWTIFRGWSDADKSPSEEYIARLLALWEWRLDVLEVASSGETAGEEADGLGWFIQTRHLPDTKVLPLAVRTMRLAPGSRQTRRMIWPRLVQLAAVDLGAVIDIARELVTAELAGQWSHLDLDQVAPVLRLGLRSSDRMLRDAAKRLVHDLGDRGYNEFGALLSEGETPLP